MSLKRYVGDLGIVGYVIRLAILLIFAIYFVVPAGVVAVRDHARPIQPVQQLVPAHIRIYRSTRRCRGTNIIAYQNGEMLLWLGNSIRYAGLSLLGSLAICIPAGYILAIGRFPGRRVLLWLTLITMLLPVSAMVLPLFLELNLAQAHQHAVGGHSACDVLSLWRLSKLRVLRLQPPLGNSSTPPAWMAARNLRVFWNLALPLARPLLGLLAFISFNANWNNFFGPYVMLNDRHALQPAGWL
jgi:ABC-type glycerol-3-phosphate transport system permease component